MCHLLIQKNGARRVSLVSRLLDHRLGQKLMCHLLIQKMMHAESLLARPFMPPLSSLTILQRGASAGAPHLTSLTNLHIAVVQQLVSR